MGQMEARSSAPRERTALFVYFAPLVVFYLVFLVAPYLVLLRMSFNQFSSTQFFVEALTLENYVAVLGDPFYLALLGRTVALGLVVALVTLALGYPLALKVVRAGPRLKTLLLALTISPLLINLVVRTYAWLVLLGDRGVINTWLLDLGLSASPVALSRSFGGVVVGLAHITLPLMVLSLVSVMEMIKPNLFEAAESLGATPGQVLRRVILPLSMPGIGTGSLLVFCYAVSAFVTPALLGGNRVSTVSTVIYEKFTFSMNWPVGASLVFVLLALNLLVIALHARLFHAR